MERPLDHRTAQSWLDRYVAAWKTYDADAIADLFAPTVVYRYHPESRRGRLGPGPRQ